MMTPQGYRNRLYAIEWHGRLWLRYGTPFDLCDRMVRYCSEVLDADYYQVERPETDDPHITAMQAHFDRLFSSGGCLVSFE